MSRVDVRRPRRRIPLGGLVALALVTAGLVAGGALAATRSGPPVVRANEVQHGIVYARGNGAGHGHGGGGGGSVPLLLWHNGDVMTAGAVVDPIYWGPSWSSSSFVGDKIDGLASFYQGIGGSSYIGTNLEYTDSGGHVSGAVTSGPSYMNASATPRSAPSTSTVLAIVASRITNPVSNGYYPVYSDMPRGHAGYCAWHSYGTINGVPVQFAFFFNLDGDPGCDPHDTTTTHSQGLAALANVSGHELSEALTDPRNGGWYDSSGAENADKCAWTFNGTETLGHTPWMIQGNFSNDAAAAHSGYDGAGCVNGNN
jgi:hypothetical protein